MQKVEFCRICELQSGDLFLFMGTWLVVSYIKNGRFYCRYTYEAVTQGHRHSFGAKSQQFVQVQRAA